MTTRRDFLAASAAAAAAAAAVRPAHAAPVRSGAKVASRPVPSAAQLQWQRDEFAMFVHFGVNTFTDREWGDGTEQPAIFNPTQLDAGQWARTAKAAGVKTMILTAKHHDGFCLWPTRTTRHSVAASPFRGGTGDVVKEFADAARREGLKVGLYCSPWDRNHPTFGSPAYLDTYLAQLTELLSNYGDIVEVWFDGANGEGPTGRKQIYDWPRIWGHVRQLAPNAVMFSDAGPDVRWIGNERGSAGDPNWSMVNPDIVREPGVWGPEIERSLQHGDRTGTVWRPGETDVSIRKGWFYHDTEQPKSAETLHDIWFSSVGRNSKLLLNVPPNPAGLIAGNDVTQLTQFRALRDGLAAAEIKGVSWRWRVDVSRRLVGEGTLPKATSIGVVQLGEDIAKGQLVAAFTMTADGPDGRPRPMVQGQTIGHCRLERTSDAETTRRVTITVDDAIAMPEKLSIRLFAR